MTPAIIALILLALAAVDLARASRGPSPRDYAHRLTLARWHSEQEWRALDTIVRRESNWNPCAHWPHMSECGYKGSNSCGIPQANPCPSSWRGNLWDTRFAQVRWLIDYVQGRYGSPGVALAYWDAHRSY